MQQNTEAQDKDELAEMRETMEAAYRAIEPTLNAAVYDAPRKEYENKSKRRYQNDERNKRRQKNRHRSEIL